MILDAADTLKEKTDSATDSLNKQADLVFRAVNTLRATRVASLDRVLYNPTKLFEQWQNGTA